MNGRLTEDKKYIAETIIPCYQVDIDKKMKPTAFMDLAQEMAYLAADSLNFGYEGLIGKNLAWILSRMHMSFEEMPAWEDHVELSTWSKGPLGPFYLRDFLLKDCEGNIRIRCTSSWVVMNLADRRMCRPSDINDYVPESSFCSDIAIESPAERISIPKTLTPEVTDTHRVSYSDVDLVGHTNNVRYVAWSLDCIGLDNLRGKRINDIWINFNNETKAGDTVILERVYDNGIWWVEGKIEGKSAFCCKIKISE